VVEISQKQLEETATDFLVQSRGMSKDLIYMDLSDGCLFSVRVEKPSSTTPIILGVVIGVLLSLVVGLVIAVLWYRNLQVNLSVLPKEVRWQYEQAQARLNSWKSYGSGDYRCYYKHIPRGSDEWKNMAYYFYDILGADDSLPITEAYVVYNPTLVSNFVNHISILKARLSNHKEVFGKQDWRLKEMSENRLNITKFFEERRDATGWQSKYENEPVILPTVHGTEFNCAKSICSTGFATLSSIDSGWYGSGIYFTTFAMYAF